MIVMVRGEDDPEADEAVEEHRSLELLSGRIVARGGC